MLELNDIDSFNDTNTLIIDFSNDGKIHPNKTNKSINLKRIKKKGKKSRAKNYLSPKLIPIYEQDDDEEDVDFLEELDDDDDEEERPLFAKTGQFIKPTNKKNGPKACAIDDDDIQFNFNDKFSIELNINEVNQDYNFIPMGIPQYYNYNHLYNNNDNSNNVPINNNNFQPVFYNNYMKFDEFNNIQFQNVNRSIPMETPFSQSKEFNYELPYYNLETNEEAEEKSEEFKKDEIPLSDDLIYEEETNTKKRLNNERRNPMSKRSKTIVMSAFDEFEDLNNFQNKNDLAISSVSSIYPEFEEKILDFSNTSNNFKFSNTKINNNKKFDKNSKSIIFKNGSMLTKSKLINNNIKKSNTPTIFTCEHCQAKFKVKGYLSRHLKRHSTYKAFICPFFKNEITNDDKKISKKKIYSIGTKCHPTGGFSRRDTYKTHLKAIHFIYPAGTKSTERNDIAGRCAGCFEYFENNNIWLENHIENGNCKVIINKMGNCNKRGKKIKEEEDDEEDGVDYDDLK